MAENKRTSELTAASTLDGTELMHVVQGGNSRQTTAVDVANLSGFNRDDVTALLADTTLTYTAGQPGTVAAGGYVQTRAEGFSYQVAASGASDQHVTTAGGVKLYVLPVDGAYPLAALGPVTSATIATAVSAFAGEVMAIDAGTYSLTSGADFSGLAGLRLGGDVELDFTSITDVANVPGRGYVTISGGALVALPDLASDTVEGATSITLASAPSGLAVGDWICIYNPTDYSFSNFSSVYRDGQWARVAGISGATITLFHTILRAYPAATVDVYRHPGATFSISGGRLFIKESLYNDANLNAKAGFYAERILDADFSMVRPLQADYGAMLLRQCLGIRGTGYMTTQPTARSGGVNYGLVMVGCQNGEITGDFYGYNHGVTVGGGSYAGDVPDRYLTVRGRFSAHPGTTIGAANFHGHCEYIHFDGVFDGGVTGGGDYLKVSGVVRGRGNQSCVYLNELRGANIDLSGLRIETLGDPHLNTSGVIDVGANAINQLTADTVNGGTINMRGVVIHAPNSQRGMVIRNRGCTQDVALDVTGMVCTLASGGFHLIDAISGSDFTDFLMRDARLGTSALQYLKNIGTFHGWEIVGEVELTTLTSQPNRSTSVSYQAPWNLVPKIVTALNGDRIVGGKPIVCGAESRTNTEAFIFLNSADNANFSSSEACTIAYRITV